MNIVRLGVNILVVLISYTFIVGANTLRSQSNPETLPVPNIRVNQVGYLPNSSKKATMVSSSSSALDWSLKDKSGSEIAKGKTTPKFGIDKASGDAVHTLDFSSVTKNGNDYMLVVTDNGKQHISHPFAISNSIYSKMKKDALAYFYYNRSGIEIKMPYCGREDLAREAGHLPDKATTWPNSGQENYELDVTGGWYDAGDYGKYVVNGGISVWTMMMQYERAVVLSKASQYADGTMSIPENKNGIPDLLDESRWQMEFMLKMQVPEGKKMAGMVHHKMHNQGWAGLPSKPSDDTSPRFLRPVSTAATLNLAATAAQAARLWKTYDAGFSSKCLTAAEKAWAAAIKNPNIHASFHSEGGGPYNDEYTGDEFYWAACELYATTGKDVYLTKCTASPHYLKMPSIMSKGEDKDFSGCFTWGSTEGLGTVTLALTKSNLPEADKKKAQNACAAASDVWIKTMETEGYTIPMSGGPTGYPWGSNSFILNQTIVMALAHDFTNNSKYFNSIVVSMGYILGRNANDQCYVSGYGERPLQNPHHRFWAYQANKEYPKLPAGVVSGGPNSGLQDPYAQSAVKKVNGVTSPAKCFVDHIDSYSTNEITINWNAPFAWITAYLDENNTLGSTSIKHTFNARVKSQTVLPAIAVSKKGIAVSLGSSKRATVSIYSASGHKLFSENITSKSGMYTLGYGSVKHTAGLYVVNVSTAVGNVRKSIVVQK